MYASQNGHEEVVNTLLQQHGASVEMPDNVSLCQQKNLCVIFHVNTIIARC